VEEATAGEKKQKKREEESRRETEGKRVSGKVNDGRNRSRSTI